MPERRRRDERRREGRRGMTRRGSVAYYLAAWVVGGFIAAFAFWWLNGREADASGLLLEYFFALIIGAVDLLLFAFLLRQAMRWSQTHNAAVWAVTGAALFFVLLGLLTAIS